jgi:hypothetical protein
VADPPTPRPRRREEWRCAAHEPLIERVSAIDERTQRILELLEQARQRDDELDRRQREDYGRGREQGGTLAAVARSAGLLFAFGAGLGAIVAAVAAILEIVGG